MFCCRHQRIICRRVVLGNHTKIISTLTDEKQVRTAEFKVHARRSIAQKSRATVINRIKHRCILFKNATERITICGPFCVETIYHQRRRQATGHRPKIPENAPTRSTNTVAQTHTQINSRTKFTHTHTDSRQPRKLYHIPSVLATNSVCLLCSVAVAAAVLPTLKQVVCARTNEQRAQTPSLTSQDSVGQPT